jgi:KUP system potassium uptake protein
VQNSKSSLAALTLGAIGIVYGDIGTSVLYALKVLFNTGHVPLTPANVYGVLSLVFWTVTIIVSLKYVTLILRADNNGEGGLIAMLALASNAVADRPRLRGWLLGVGIFGTAIFYGDGVITPAISVLSAVEGVSLISPAFTPYVVPAALVIIFMLFYVQRNGTAGIGRLFGPVCLVWFLAIAALGIPHIVAHPEVLAAVSPHHALRFIVEQKGTAFVLLGALVLTVTGTEALYADLGHFGKKPIRLAWFGLVMPCLLINYFGQGALLLQDPKALENPFYLMAPSYLLVPLVILATAATVIASQALLSAAFSVTKQAIQLGYLPRMLIRHTSVHETGQVYVPAVNWLLFATIVVAVGLFRNSTNLASAYGIAVTTDMLITTVLTFFVIRYAWKLPLWLCIAATSMFFVVDLMFFASNALKLLDGGWFPVLIGIAMFIVMMTWKKGRAIVAEKLRSESFDLRSFLESIFVSPPTRVQGTAVFLTPEPGTVPNAMLHNLKHNKVLHERVLFVTVLNEDIPTVGPDRRREVAELAPGIHRVIIRYGFQESPNIPRELEQLREAGVAWDAMQASYFLGRETLVAAVVPKMSRWRQWLFQVMSRNAVPATEFFRIPSDRVVELGVRVAI